METFSTIRFKIKIALRFRRFSKQVAKTHSEALESMLNFFDWNDLSPTDNLGIRNERTNKRINALIAIVKNIEKHQTKPTQAMIRTLFEEVSKNEMDEEIYPTEIPNAISENEELNYYRNEYETIRKRNANMRVEMDNILKRTTYIKSNFGQSYFKLEMTKEEFEQLKRNL